MKSLIKVALIGVVALSLAVSGLLALDYYYYSWISFIRPFGCEYKHIAAKYEDNKLDLNYDLIAIRNVVKSNPDFKLETPNKSELYNQNQLGISKMYGDVKYNISISKNRTSSGNFTEVEFDNFNFDSETAGHYTPWLHKGEEKTTPDYQIRKNIEAMIDEMPLNDSQKVELKGKVIVTFSTKPWSMP